MINPKEILVTTTPSIDGLNIIQYIKPISAHVVAGTGFFSDFAASLSDVFGGRSQTYQRQLSSIYNEAIECLKRTASEVGGDCIVGLRVDLDEISGKGKSMFMITAIGTAVVIHKSTINSKYSLEKNESISHDKMIDLKERRKLVQAAKDNTLILDDSTWEFLSVNHVQEIAKEILTIAKSEYEGSYGVNENVYQKLKTYLYAISEDVRTSLLYEYLMENSSGRFDNCLYWIIKDLMIFDALKLEQYLSSDDKTIKRKALLLVENDKPYYSIDDVAVFEKFIFLIEQNYPIQVEYSTRKKMLSSKESSIWICSCGENNEIESTRCTTCSRDLYGYSVNEFNPLMVIEHLKENIKVIKNYFT